MDDELGAEHRQPRPRWLSTRRGKIEAVLTAFCFVAIAVLLLVLVRDPSDSDNAGTSTTATTEAERTTSTSLTPEGEIERAYRAFDEMLQRLDAAPDPGDPEIARRTTGELRTKIEASFGDRRSRGEALKLGPQRRLTILSTAVDGNAATMKSCVVDDAAVIKIATGAEVEAETTVTELQTIKFVREEGVWKLGRIGTDGEHRWRGVSDCDA